MASPNIKPGYQRGVRGRHRTGWLSRRNYKKRTEIEKELGRSGVCREYKTRTEESRIKKINNVVMFTENLIRVRTKGRMPRISGGGVVQVNPRQSLVGHSGWF